MSTISGAAKIWRQSADAATASSNLIAFPFRDEASWRQPRLRGHGVATSERSSTRRPPELFQDKDRLVTDRLAVSKGAASPPARPWNAASASSSNLSAKFWGMGSLRRCRPQSYGGLRKQGTQIAGFPYEDPNKVPLTS